MPSGDAIGLTAAGAARQIRDGKLTPAELTEACLARIAAVEPAVRAWVHVDEAGARAAAAERTAEARSGRIRGPLHGVPVGIKDIIDVAGMPTTGGARAWAHTRPAVDATVVARLRAAGAVIVGKTVTTEFAYRDPGPTHNPWRLGHTPGGSSSGSGAAVGARMVPVALGTQTVGSVLRPAAYCGVVGLKATHGLVPADAVIPLAWSLDHVGVLARSVEDAALTLSVMAARQYTARPGRPPRLALAPELLARAEPETAARVRACAEAFARAGATVSEVALPPSFAKIHEVGTMVLECEASTYHEPTWRAHEKDYGREYSAMVGRGVGHPAIAYVRANRARLAFRDDVMPLLAAHDALLSPTAPGLAPAGLAWTGDAAFCAPWSSAGVPAITLPSGVAASGLPEAVQLVAAAGAESSLLAAAAWCEGVLAFTGVAPLAG
jgi:Asp-tRNA(Asn)/Glu-tRNA(Gln) amidotransferase A subunit family amidase